MAPPHLYAAKMMLNAALIFAVLVFSLVFVAHIPGARAILWANVFLLGWVLYSWLPITHDPLSFMYLTTQLQVGLAIFAVVEVFAYSILGYGSLTSVGIAALTFFIFQVAGTLFLDPERGRRPQIPANAASRSVQRGDKKYYFFSQKQFNSTTLLLFAILVVCAILVSQ